MIGIQNIDDSECFKLYLVRYLYPADHHPASAREIDKLFGNKLDFEYVKFLVKITDICKIVKKNRISIRVFSYEIKAKYPSYVSKKCFEEKILIYY